MPPSPLQQAHALLQEASRVLVLTGAGVSAESGVPTFRDADGLWRRYDPMQLATPEAFRRDPRTVWAWYRWRQQRVAACAPNAAHNALVRLEERLADGFLLATQNVDGLHRRAGSRRMVELHGDLYADRCSRCERPSPASAERWVDAPPPDRPDLDPEPLRCEACGGLLRPGVVWFGESLPTDAFEQAEAAARSAEVLLVAGTSGTVWPAAGLAGLTRRSGGSVVVINPAASAVDDEAALLIRGAAAVVLPQLVD